MIELLDRALKVATGPRYLSRNDVARLLKHLHELAAFIENRYYHVLQNEDEDAIKDRHEDWINDDPF